MKARSMVTRQTVPGHRSRVREAFESIAFVVILLGGILVLSLQDIR